MAEKRFIHATLKLHHDEAPDEFRDETIEVMVDTLSRVSINDQATLIETSYRSYCKPRFGKFLLAVTPHGNPFWSDPKDHVYGYTITFRGDPHRVISPGETLVQGRRIEVDTPYPISTARWVSAIRNAFSKYTDIPPPPHRVDLAGPTTTHAADLHGRQV